MATKADCRDLILWYQVSGYANLLSTIADEVIQIVFEAEDLDNDNNMSKTEFKNLVQVSNLLSICFYFVMIASMDNFDYVSVWVSVPYQFRNT